MSWSFWRDFLSAIFHLFYFLVCLLASGSCFSKYTNQEPESAWAHYEEVMWHKQQISDLNEHRAVDIN